MSVCVCVMALATQHILKSHWSLTSPLPLSISSEQDLSSSLALIPGPESGGEEERDEGLSQGMIPSSAVQRCPQEKAWLTITCQ